jgi:beta-xylosidase
MSTDFINWQLVLNDDGTEKDSLPVTGTWVNMTTANTWAPDIVQLDDGSFIMYYSATSMASPGGAHHCVGAASSKTILGPYVPLNSTLACPLAQGGAIDASGMC